MLSRGASLLLVAALVASGTSAPFAHVHVHSDSHGHDGEGSASSAARVDEHCAHHQAAGVHWHVPESRPAATDGAPEAASYENRHAAVALKSPAIESARPAVDPAPALAAVLETAVVSGLRAGSAPVAALAGPDPPPGAVPASRAPPIRA